MSTIARKDSVFSVHELISILTRQTSKLDWSIRVVTLILPLLFLAVIVLQPWVNPTWMFLDPLTAAALSDNCCHSYFGFVSALGVMLWVATASICLFSASLVFASALGTDVFRFSLTAGLLTGWLALDDAFRLHESVMLTFGIPQTAVLAHYCVLAITYLVTSLRTILANDFWLLLIGGGALVVSLAVDIFFHDLSSSLVIVEDSAKFLGFLSGLRST